MQNRLKTTFMVILFAAYLCAGQKKREEKTWEEEMLQINMHYHRYDDKYSGWYLWLRTGRENSLSYEFYKNDSFGGMVSCSIKIVKGITNTGFMIRHADQGASWDMREICSERSIDTTQSRNGFLDLYVIQDESDIGYWKPEILQMNPSNKVIVPPLTYITAMETTASEQLNQSAIQSTSFLQSNKLPKILTNGTQTLDGTDLSEKDLGTTNSKDMNLNEEDICDLEFSHMETVGSEINNIKISANVMSSKNGGKNIARGKKNIEKRMINRTTGVNDIGIRDTKTGDTKTGDTKTGDTITSYIRTNEIKTDNTITDNEITDYIQTKETDTQETDIQVIDMKEIDTQETQTNIIIKDDTSTENEIFSDPATYENSYHTTFHLLLVIASAVVIVAVTFLVLQICK